MIGTYHHMSEAYLGRYCAEFYFRYNTRKVTDAERTDAAMNGARGKRLTYRRTDKLAAQVNQSSPCDRGTPETLSRLIRSPVREAFAATRHRPRTLDALRQLSIWAALGH